MKKWSFRRALFHDTQEMQFIVTADTQIPHLFEHDFPTDPQITKNRFNYFIEKFTEKDFFDVAIDEQN